jgi:glycosyltransferase involved in cell wall biosynthesis
MHSGLIALDFSTLDHLSLGNGQYRYAVSLINGLATLNPAADFLLLGSHAEPVAGVKELFANGQNRWRYFQLRHAKGRGAFWRDQMHYAWFLRRERVGLFHSLHGYVPMLALCPVVITQYDLMFELFTEYASARASRSYRINKWAVRHRVRRAICISATTAVDLQNLWHLKPDRLDVIYLGNHLTQFDESGDAGSGNTLARRTEADSPMLLSPYNLEPRKNLAVLLEATAKLKARYPKIKLILFGRAAITAGGERMFEQRVAELGIAETVERTGFVADAELSRLYRSADVFVFPSLYEGFGLPVLEAMACGACVVARDASAMAEVVGDAGVLVETREAGALAQGITELLDDPARRSDLGERARQRAATFTVERMAELTYRTYQRTLGAA